MICVRPSAEAADIQLTDSGEDGVIYNGIPDWVSEEEVFEDNKVWKLMRGELLF